MKKTIIAMLALSGVAFGAENNSNIDDLELVIGGNYYAAPFSFTFTIDTALTEGYAIIGAYHGAEGGSTANVNAFTLNYTADGMTLSMDRMTSISSYDLDSTTTKGVVNNTLTFGDGVNGDIYLTTGVEYTLQYNGGANKQASATLLANGEFAGMIMAGSYNLSGGGTNGVNPMLWTSNEDYVNSVTIGGTTTTYAPAIPEPTTATLSLLALAGLAARRRRK